jgi:hypothetical protein
VSALMTATIAGGAVSALNIIVAGSGYRTVPTLTIASPP